MSEDKKWIKKSCSGVRCSKSYFVHVSWSKSPELCEECRASSSENAWPILCRYFTILNSAKKKFAEDEIIERKDHLELLFLFNRAKNKKQINEFIKKAVKNKEIRKLIIREEKIKGYIKFEAKFKQSNYNLAGWHVSGGLPSLGKKR